MIDNFLDYLVIKKNSKILHYLKIGHECLRRHEIMKMYVKYSSGGTRLS